MVVILKRMLAPRKIAFPKASGALFSVGGLGVTGIASERVMLSAVFSARSAA